MKIIYDKSSDAVYIRLLDLPVNETREDVSGNINIDYAQDNSVIGIEILNASAKITKLDTTEPITK